MLADLQLALAKALAEGHATRIGEASEALMAATDPESTGRFMFDHHLRSGLPAAEAAGLILRNWPPELPFPAFLRKHPDPTVIAEVALVRQLERDLEAKLESMKSRFQIVSSPRPWPND